MITLYIKTHNITGLKYFGKTTRPNVDHYVGSGVYWLKHLRQHGRDLSTTVVATFSDDNIDECVNYAIEFSRTHNIVESSEWANLIEENGLDGSPLGRRHTEVTKAKISFIRTGIPAPKRHITRTEPIDVKSLRLSVQNKGRVWVNNGTSEFRIHPTEIPDGVTYGRLVKVGQYTLGLGNKSGNNTRGKRIYNNGETHKFFLPGTAPEGWVLGKMEGYQGGTGSARKGRKFGSISSKGYRWWTDGAINKRSHTTPGETFYLGYTKK